MAEQRQVLWERFRQRAEAIEPGNPVDPRSRPLYLIILTATALELAYLLTSDFTMSSNNFLRTFFVMIWVALTGLVFRRYGNRKISGMLEAFALPPIVGALTAVSTVFLTTVSLPFADALLARADQAIGFDWLSLFGFYQRHPWIFRASELAYSSIYLQLSLVALCLFATDRTDRGWAFMTAWAFASLITVLVYPFFPAAGPYLQYGVGPQDIPNFDAKFPWQTAEIIAGIRDGSIRDLSKAMTGLVSFPSFHFAAAVLFAWGIAPVRWLRYPIIGLNIAMGFSTIIIGSHYLIDLFSGTLVAILAIWLGKSAVQRAATTVA